MPPLWVEMNVGAQTMEGYHTRPEGDDSPPAVIVIQEIGGVNPHIQYVTDRMPALGYVGLDPDTLHREGLVS